MEERPNIVRCGILAQGRCGALVGARKHANSLYELEPGHRGRSIGTRGHHQRVPWSKLNQVNNEQGPATNRRARAHSCPSSAAHQHKKALTLVALR